MHYFLSPNDSDYRGRIAYQVGFSNRTTSVGVLVRRASPAIPVRAAYSKCEDESGNHPRDSGKRASISRPRLSEIEREYRNATPAEEKRLTAAPQSLISAKAKMEAFAAEVGWPMMKVSV
jgi:hypothetical protein